MKGENWLELSERSINYHRKQWEDVKQSTIKFCDWLDEKKVINNHLICDMCCGGGGTTQYLANRYSFASFIGIDINKNLIQLANNNLLQQYEGVLEFRQGNLYKLSTNYINKFDGIIMFQTLSWLPEYKTPIKKLTQLNPKWIAISSLFYEGEVDCIIKTTDYSNINKKGKPRIANYNIYSMNKIKELFNEYGYKKFSYIPFIIDIDLLKPEINGMTTYTIKNEKNERMQISGPLLMPWYFILAEK